MVCRQLTLHAEVQRATVAEATSQLLDTALRGCVWADVCDGGAPGVRVASAAGPPPTNNDVQALRVAHELLPRVGAAIRQMPSQVSRSRHYAACSPTVCQRIRATVCLGQTGSAAYVQPL